MAKKGKSKKPFEHVLSSDDVRPGPLAYASATLLVIVRWAKRHRVISLIILAVLVAGFGWLAYSSSRSPKNLTNDAIISQVNDILSIEGDGNPAILTVDDESKANKAQPFLDVAENGDKVLLYYKAKQAVLFRPANNEIIRKGSFTPPNAKIFIRDGTQQDNKIDEVKSKLKPVEGVDLVSTDSSVRQDYSGITLVSVTDRYDEKLSELETLFNTKVQRIPAGETFPDADIMIIVGN